ncbi:bll5006 [Bradyrhizobium diazoefficiens USDA 110]|uniref:Bll5006 protein n=1 Tax=Bradyrhizobium diazoefficiens (strain JCM 10833 / BCRC 13528 / IAM 13628 / NBRC 14792 / USDA 110) TaxID=224911 RepID=Q89KA3_BRADU|nr:hypothetical protein Bdiaspc4_26300 [Bradyrhizobium diazoefficiens]BAC50271.1 bll5006 [Bradyrhizobium diazoefficiens USDA 110]
MGLASPYSLNGWPPDVSSPKLRCKNDISQKSQPVVAFLLSVFIRTGVASSFDGRIRRRLPRVAVRPEFHRGRELLAVLRLPDPAFGDPSTRTFVHGVGRAISP